MDTFRLKIFFLLLVSVFRISEVGGKNNKIKIIVPHKISVIHHHHSRIPNLKPKKKLHFDFHDFLKSHQIHQEENEEEESEEEHFGQYLGEADEEASQRDIAYYPIPTTEYSSNPVRLFKKPMFLFNEFFHRKHPPRFEYHSFQDFNYPEENYKENRYYVKGFR